MRQPSGSGVGVMEGVTVMVGVRVSGGGVCVAVGGGVDVYEAVACGAGEPI